MSEPSFSVEPTTLSGETKFVCTVEYRGQRYICRYGYDSEQAARSVLGNLRRTFTTGPASVETYIAFNCYRVTPETVLWRYTRLTSRKTNWNIVK